MVFCRQDRPIIRIVLVIRLRWNLIKSYRISSKTRLITIKVGFLSESNNKVEFLQTIK